MTFDYIADPLDPSLRNTAIPFIYNYVSEVGMDIMRKRLMSALEDAPFYALDVQTGIVPYLNRISYRLSVECAPEDYADAYVLILNEVERVLRYGISEREFRRSSGDFMDGLEETYSRRSSLDNRYYRDLCVSNFTDGYVMTGIEPVQELYRDSRDSSGQFDGNRFPVICVLCGQQPDRGVLFSRIQRGTGIFRRQTGTV